MVPQDWIFRLGKQQTFTYRRHPKRAQRVEKPAVRDVEISTNMGAHPSRAFAARVGKHEPNKLIGHKQIMKATHLLIHSAATLFLAATLAQAATVTALSSTKPPANPPRRHRSPRRRASRHERSSPLHHRRKRLLHLNEPGSALPHSRHPPGRRYFIAAPRATPRRHPVYDVAAKVDGVSIEADVFEVEGDANQLHVTERYFIHNTSMPRAPSGPALLRDRHTTRGHHRGVAAQRPTGLPPASSSTPPAPRPLRFQLPHPADEGEKDTLFQIEYTVPTPTENSPFIRSHSAHAKHRVLLPRA